MSTPDFLQGVLASLSPRVAPAESDADVAARIAAAHGDPNPFRIAAEPTDGSEPLDEWRRR